LGRGGIREDFSKVKVVLVSGFLPKVVAFRTFPGRVFPLLPPPQQEPHVGVPPPSFPPLASRLLFFPLWITHGSPVLYNSSRVRPRQPVTSRGWAGLAPRAVHGLSHRAYPLFFNFVRAIHLFTESISTQQDLEKQWEIIPSSSPFCLLFCARGSF